MPTLHWIGKDAVVNHHQTVPYRLLRDVPELGVGDPGTGNLIVEGDNLHALKALLPYYAGQVKCIYIDPPYNTGNEGWVYNDAVNSPLIQRWLGETVGKESEDLSRHDKWLCMIYPRLQLLKQFLCEDGVIFVSIDDNELENLLLVIAEVFGNQNHLATIVWEKGKKGDSKFFSENHEYVVAYAIDKAGMVERNTRWKKRKTGVDRVLAHYQELRIQLGDKHEAIRVEMMKWYRSLAKGDPAKDHKHYNWSDRRGLYFAADFSGPDDGRESRPRYDILHPITGKPCRKPSTGWRWDETTAKAALAEDPQRIHFGPDETTIPCRKTYLLEATQEPFPTVFYKDGRAATLLVESILGKGAFAFPKDVEVLVDLIAMTTGPNDIVLDSFGGSGTTGHAVLQLNQQDSGNRRFVLVQMPHESESQRARDENIARDKTRERVKRVALGYTTAKGEAVAGLGGGFRYCRLDAPLFSAAGEISPDVRFVALARHVYFTEFQEPLSRERLPNSPLVGVCRGTGVYLLFNGILGDNSNGGGNVLTRAVLAKLPKHDGPKVIYANGCLIGDERLRAEQITFRQTPYEIATT